MKRFMAVLAFCFFTAAVCFAQSGNSVTGFWQTIDDKTKEPKSIVSVYEKDGAVFAKIIAVYTDGKLDIVKDEEGNFVANKERVAPKMDNQPFAGLVIIKDLRLDKSGKYSGGTIVDPNKGGDPYKAEIWLENGELKVRGKLGPFSRTQTWKSFPQSDFPEGFKITE
ncbi:MAG: DUF2147 domain-containing protein [Endomicrobia bacterium]|nr:DUF2147 domain-containing protein [Endomicrobiia bacterium]MCL2506940.1 DUF2147 domain-containing protein [Endomicrobiia bacterium]